MHMIYNLQILRSSMKYFFLNFSRKLIDSHKYVLGFCICADHAFRNTDIDELSTLFSKKFIKYILNLKKIFNLV